MKKLVFLAIVILYGSQCFSQTVLEYPKRPRYPDGTFSVGGGGGITKYFGEFNDEHVGYNAGFNAQYTFHPSVFLGVHAGAGRLIYDRRTRAEGVSEYRFQFNGDEAQYRHTDFFTANLRLGVNLFPRQFMNVYLYSGVGVTNYSPRDYELNSVTVQPHREEFATITVPAGIGAEIFLTRGLSIYTEGTMNFLWADDVDAFPSGELRDKYFSVSTSNVSEAPDHFATLNLGFKYFLFENKDLDGDLISNSEEETRGTNPYSSDTDDDGLNDYEEVRLYHTDPKIPDTDHDGLNDYAEAKQYLSDPNKVDTDLDLLNDGEEALVFKTNPIDKDTDHDQLSDQYEVDNGTDPRQIDSDRDGLTDYDEIFKYKTSPIFTDTDNDELEDSRELALNTDPLLSDTDGDGLTDFVEVELYHSSPTNKDTDIDHVSDFVEVRERGTDPADRDTDGDGVADDVDRCPKLIGSRKSDGCPEFKTIFIDAPNVTNNYRIDTIVIREGASLTLYGVNFETAKAIIRPESFPILEQDAKLFSMHPHMFVEIRGHTDSRGGELSNLRLSLARAESVKRFMLKMGVEEHRMTTRGFGESAPLMSNETEEGRAHNRRIEFYILRNTTDGVSSVVPNTETQESHPVTSMKSDQ